MKRLSFCLAPVMFVALALLAGGCERSTAPTVTPAQSQAAGMYWCTSAAIDGVELGAQGQWLHLQEDGTATLFLIGEPDEGGWTLNGTQFTMTIGAENVATGTLEQGVLQVKLMEMDCVFLREDLNQTEALPEPTPGDTAAPETTDGTATFTCYGDLYQITYPTALFSPSGDGLTDLISNTGAKAWVTRLDSKEAVAVWLARFQQEATDTAATTADGTASDGTPTANPEDAATPIAPTLLTFTAAESPAQALITFDGNLWHSEIIVDFGRDVGTKDYPMYAACLTFSGPSRESVWGEEIQEMVGSLVVG